MAVEISVPYTIMIDNGITERNPAEGLSATVRFKCLWDNRYTLVNDMDSRAARWACRGGFAEITSRIRGLLGNSSDRPRQIAENRAIGVRFSTVVVSC